MELSLPAKILGVVNIILLIIITIGMFLIKKDVQNNESTLLIVIKNIGMILLYGIFLVLQVFAVNCFTFGNTHGGCEVLAWIISIFGTIAALMFIGFFIYLLIVGKSVKALFEKQLRPIENVQSSIINTTSTVTNTVDNVTDKLPYIGNPDAKTPDAKTPETKTPDAEKPDTE